MHREVEQHVCCHSESDQQCPRGSCHHWCLWRVHEQRYICSNRVWIIARWCDLLCDQCCKSHDSRVAGDWVKCDDQWIGKDIFHGNYNWFHSTYFSLDRASTETLIVRVAIQFDGGWPHTHTHTHTHTRRYNQLGCAWLTNLILSASFFCCVHRCYSPT